MGKLFRFTKKIIFTSSLLFYNAISFAADTTGVDGVDDMLKTGRSLLSVAAKWGGIGTVVAAALALGSGRLEGALAQTVCKILIVIGLLIAASTYFGKQITWGFSF